MSQVLRHLSGHSAPHLPVNRRQHVSAAGLILLASLGATGGLAAFSLIMKLYPAG